MEKLVGFHPGFWKNNKVLVTGCTGFKGSWLVVWLNMLGADVYGYSLTPPTSPSMWEDLELERLCKRVEYADIRDFKKLRGFMQEISPEIVIHMAAQSLVKYSYDNPHETYEVNVMGTVNVLESVRHTPHIKVVINVTTDKCYENKEWLWAYRENEAMGGYDPYSNSKGCSELVTRSYESSFFNGNSETAIASARAGNVIGGGDWADNRLIPDIIKSFSKKDVVEIRYPNAIRPWQHVLEPLSGYLTLAQRLYEDRHKFSGGWNFGPHDNEIYTVGDIVAKMCQIWGDGAKWVDDTHEHAHEANYLRLDCSKARMLLNWQPVWDITTTLTNLTKWYQANLHKENMLEVTKSQILQYMKGMKC